MKEKLEDREIDENPFFIPTNKKLNHISPSRANYPHIGSDGARDIDLFGFHCTNDNCHIKKVLEIIGDQCKHGICVTTKDFRYAFFNENYRETIGFGSDELNQMRFTDAVADQDKVPFSKILKSVFKGAYPVMKFNPTVVNKNGKHILVETSSAKIHWMGKPAVVSIMNDPARYHLEKTILQKQLEQKNTEWVISSQHLQQKQKELEDYKTKLELTSKELMQTNHAMSILARNIDNEKNKSEQNISKVVMNKILPIISDLKAKPGMKKYRAELQVLNEYVNSLSHESELGDMVFSNLTETEMRIASLIKNGMSSANIADALHISIETVKTHRKKIRKKLKIQNTDTNLTTYLKMSLGE